MLVLARFSSLSYYLPQFSSILVNQILLCANLTYGVRSEKERNYKISMLFLWNFIRRCYTFFRLVYLVVDFVCTMLTINTMRLPFGIKYKYYHDALWGSNRICTQTIFIILISLPLFLSSSCVSLVPDLYSHFIHAQAHTHRHHTVNV